MENKLKKLSIIVPVYNEIRSLNQIIDKILNVPLTIEREIILVDSGSSDGSTEVIKKLSVQHGFKSIFLPQNKGKGYCIRQALEVTEGDIIIIQDADLEYDPNDYTVLLAPILQGKTQFVLGSRHLHASTWRIRTKTRKNTYMEIINFGSEFLTKLFCFVFSVQLTDTQTMYKVFCKNLLDNIELKCNGFDLDLELLGKLILSGHVPVEVPVRYESRTVSEGKKLRFFIDGLAAVYIILKVRFSNLFF